MLKVLGRLPSINVRKVLWLCHELGEPIEHTPWGDADHPLDAPAFAALNPNRMVPVIDDDGFVLWDSNTILRYLATTREATALYPLDPKQRARIDQWIDWQANDLNTAWRFPFMTLVRHAPGYEPDSFHVNAAIARWTELMHVLDGQLARTGAYITGDTFTLADIVIGLSVHRWYSVPLDHPSLPHVAAYYERLTEREGFRLHGRNGKP